MVIAFSKSYLIKYFILVLIPYAISFTCLLDIGPGDQKEGDGAYISNSGIHVTLDENGVDRSQKAGRTIYFRLFHLLSFGQQI